MLFVGKEKIDFHAIPLCANKPGTIIIDTQALDVDKYYVLKTTATEVRSLTPPPEKNLLRQAQIFRHLFFQLKEL